MKVSLKKTNKHLWMGAFLVFLLDQATKFFALDLLNAKAMILMNPIWGLKFHLVRNYSTILMNIDLTKYHISVLEMRFLYFLTSLILIFSIYFITKNKNFEEDNWSNEFLKTGLFLILGAILGNLYDRIFRTQGVIDFLSFNPNINFYLIMNVADIVLYFGEISIIIGLLIATLNELKHSKIKRYLLKI
jgi:lipoprotein signal peptidase